MSRVAKESLEEAREQLLIEISNYSAVTKGKIVCVFDAYDRGTPQSEYEYHGVHVVFTKEHETADSFIERYVYNIYNKHTTHITVVTSDMSEQHAIFWNRCLSFILKRNVAPFKREQRECDQIDGRIW